jgi:hypothetical protein
MNIITKRNSLLFVVLLLVVATTSFAVVGEGSNSNEREELIPKPVVIIAGQSNATGTNTPVELLNPKLGENEADKNVQLEFAIHHGAVWSFSHATSTLINPQPSGFFGLEVSLGRDLYSDGVNDLQILKVSDNGRKLAFSDSDQTWHPDAKISSYTQLKSQYEQLKSEMFADGKYPDVIGFVWVQGESDAITEKYADVYQQNLNRFFKQLKSDKIIYSKTGIVIAQIGPKCMERCPQADEGFAKVREAQRLFSANNNYKLIDIADMPRVAGDPIHLNAQAQQQLGKLSAGYINAYRSEQNPDYMSSLSAELK